MDEHTAALQPNIGLTIATFFGPDGIIAGAKPDFQPREGQPELSQAILQAAEDRKPLLAEAPTGFGKSFAVLVPAIIAAREQHRRIVISTETLTLQDQYVSKDLPMLQAACRARGLNFTFAVAKGRSNHVCRIKLDEENFRETSKLMLWAKGLKIGVDTGDIASVPFAFDPRDWQSVCADEDCERRACPLYGEGRKGWSDCFVYQAQANYMSADIVVANHTLTLLDLGIGAGTILGPYDWLIVDEAQSFAEKAQECWGTSFKPRTVSRAIGLITRMLGKVGIGEFNHDGGLAAGIRHLEDAMFDPFKPVLGKNIALRQVRRSIIEESKLGASRLIDLVRMENRGLSEMITRPEDDPQTVVIRACKEKLSKITSDLMAIYGDNMDPEFANNWLVFMETGYNMRRDPYPILNLRPIEVAPLMRGNLFSVIPFSVFMSATLRIGKSFGFVRASLGVPDEAVEFIGESPFNFKDSVQGYFPTHLPDTQADDYLPRLCEEIAEVVHYVKGRSLVLFTNNAHMRYCYEQLAKVLPYKCLLQGQASRGVLLDEFQRDISSCLFATRTFFTGIDIPGEALSGVILTKAPFPVPTEPMFKARADKIDDAGGSSFALLSLPLMLFDVRQVFGRLIRTTSDRGVFALLDSRAMRKSYGSRILNALPEMRKVSHLGVEAKDSYAPVGKSSAYLDLEMD